MRRIFYLSAAAVIAVAWAASSAAAATVPSTDISIPRPFPPGCGPATERATTPAATSTTRTPRSSRGWRSARTNPNDVAGIWQQDRWSDGGAHGLVAAVSHNGGVELRLLARRTSATAPAARPPTAATSAAHRTRGCRGRRTATCGRSACRSTGTTTRNAVLVSRMRHGSSDVERAVVLKFDTSRAGSRRATTSTTRSRSPRIRTDPSGNLVYAVWDRFVSPNENAPLPALRERARVPPADLVLAHHQRRLREPDLAVAGDLRPGHTERDDLQPDRGRARRDAHGRLLPVQDQPEQPGHARATSSRSIRSTDKGATWSRQAIIVAPASAIGETDPEPINCRPFITGNPPCTLVRSDGVIIDLAVDYSSGPHHGRLYMTWQDHARQPVRRRPDHAVALRRRRADAGRPRRRSTRRRAARSPTRPSSRPSTSTPTASSRCRYYDFRNDVSGDGALTTDHWIVHSHDGGATWTENHLGGPFDMHQAPYARGYFVGDYQGLDSQGSAFRTLFTLASPELGVFPEPQPDGRVHLRPVLMRTGSGAFAAGGPRARRVGQRTLASACRAPPYRPRGRTRYLPGTSSRVAMRPVNGTEFGPFTPERVSAGPAAF